VSTDEAKLNPPKRNYPVFGCIYFRIKTKCPELIPRCVCSPLRYIIKTGSLLCFHIRRKFWWPNVEHRQCYY